MNVEAFPEHRAIVCNECDKIIVNYFAIGVTFQYDGMLLLCLGCATKLEEMLNKCLHQ